MVGQDAFVLLLERLDLLRLLRVRDAERRDGADRDSERGDERGDVFTVGG